MSSVDSCAKGSNLQFRAAASADRVNSLNGGSRMSRSVGWLAGITACSASAATPPSTTFVPMR
jgi:hypothetical protein